MADREVLSRTGPCCITFPLPDVSNNFLKTLGSCLEMTVGIVQVGIQWFLFTSVCVPPVRPDSCIPQFYMCSLVLYILYYPPHLKYTDIDFDIHDSRPPRVKDAAKSPEWSLSITLAWIVFLHLSVVHSPASLSLTQRNIAYSPPLQRSLCYSRIFLPLPTLRCPNKFHRGQHFSAFRPQFSQLSSMRLS